MFFILESYADENGIQRMVDAVRSVLGPDSYRLFSHAQKYYDDEDILKCAKKAEGPIWFQGSIQAADMLQEEGVDLGIDWDRYRFSSYATPFAEFLVSREFDLVPFKNLSIYLENIWVFDGRAQMFMRPDSCRKLFSGGVYFAESVGRSPGTELGMPACAPEDLVVIAEPVDIYEEYRFFVVGNKIIAGVTYETKGKFLPSGPPATDEAIEFANVVLDAVDYRPAPIFVLDIAKLDDGYGVIELNCAPCAGIYGCDAGKLIEGIIDETNKAHY